MAFCTRNGGKLFYSVLGKGEPLLMLRGLGRSSRYWLGFEKLLAKHFRIILIDHRGIGQSTVPMLWNDRIEALAEDCVAVLDKLQIKSCHIFGLSLGGMVAMSLAAHHPERVRRLMVAASSSADYLGFRMHPRAIQRLICALPFGRMQATLMEEIVPGPVLRSRRDELSQAWNDIISSEGFPRETIAKQVLAASRFRIARRIDTQKTPTLIIHGSEDRFVPPYNSRRLHKLIKGSQFRSIQGAGHEISLGHEQEICGIIRDFARPS